MTTNRPTPSREDLMRAAGLYGKQADAVLDLLQGGTDDCRCGAPNELHDPVPTGAVVLDPDTLTHLAELKGGTDE